MQVRTLHPWDVSPQEAIDLQRELTSRITQTPLFPSARARLIAGVDVSSSKFSPLLTAGIVVWDRQTGQIVDTADAQTEESFPYVPGLLSFREIPVLALALQKLRSQPNIILVDGQGRAHPRRLGIASHLGLMINCPTIGVAKSILVGSGEDPGPNPGDTSPLMHQEELVGQILRTKQRVKPVYVSVGNNITLNSAVEIVTACLRGYRLPEPTRLAHLHVNAVRIGAMPSLQRSLL